MASAGGSFKVQGHSLQCSQQFEHTDGIKGDCSDQASGGMAPDEDSDFKYRPGELGSEDMMSHVIAVNKNLVQQLDALRLRLEIDFKHGQEQRALVLKETDTKLEEKTKSLSNLKAEVHDKTKTLSQLTDDNDKKSKEIDELQRQIEDLKKDVGDTRIYADELELEMSKLQLDKGKLQTGSAYQEKEEEIRGLHREIDFLRRNLSRLEKELTKAKEMISQQGSKVRFIENENKNSLVKFKEELNKISLNMRFEIGKMREVMRSQWREMKDLREQNEMMSKDIREIRDLLVEQNKAKTKKATVREQANSTPSQLITKSDHMINMAFKPAFPVRSKDKNNLQTKKNRV